MIKESDYLLSNQEILGGIKSAISRGETLKEAMMTFYQAGYDKTEIEEAAKAYLNETNSYSKEENTRNPPIEKKNKIPEIKKANTPKINNKKSPEINTPKQKVSNYIPEAKIKKKGKGFTILLVIILVLLVGFLLSILILGDKFIDLLEGLF